MSMTDPIADLLTRIRNGQLRGKITISMPLSKQKLAIAELLRDEGYLAGVSIEEHEMKPQLVLRLKYYRGKTVNEQIKRESRTCLRIYRGKNDILTVCDGLGVAIVSTSSGLMTDRAAREAGQGGEIIAYVA